MRDWTETLFEASYNGVPFYTERDGFGGGRRNGYSELPGVDMPLYEDLGGKMQPLEVTGYTLGDFSDLQMTALRLACNSPGPGVLVLASEGPLPVACDDFKRDRSKDRAGYFGFTAKFTLVGSAASASPPEYLAQLAFDAVGALRNAAAGFLSQVRI